MLPLLLTLAALAVPVRVDDVTNPQAHHRGWVSDMANVLDPSAEADLEVRLERMHLDLTVEVALVTVDDVDAASPRDFANRLFNAWGLGNREANNGLLVLLVLDQRRIEMETGYGLEGVLTDGWLGGVRTEHMVPAFKRGDFGAGLVAGIDVIDERLRAYPEEARLGTRGEVRVADRDAGSSWSDDLLLAGGLGTGSTGLAVLGMLLVRRRRRTCPTCNKPMRRLSDEEEDAHLESGHGTEEAIGSVQWTVYQCETCQHTRTFRSDRWFSGYTKCPKCSFKTRKTTSVTTSQPTEHSTGSARVDEVCVNCSYRHSYTRILPRLPPPPPPSSSSSGGGGYSGGSSGGGGSFGGGSSGGGGGGSSW